MIEFQGEKREFLYLLLTPDAGEERQVSRFPLISPRRDHPGAYQPPEFHKFLQEKENEALLDRMVIIKIPYALSYRDESRTTEAGVGCAGVPQRHLDPHVLNLTAVFGILTR